MGDNQLKKLLDRYFNQKVQLLNPGKQKAMKVWEPVVDEILEYVKRNDDRFDFSKCYGGSFYERTKTKEPNEFDVLLEIPSLSLGKDTYDGREDSLHVDPPSGYTTVMIDEGEERIWIPNKCIQMPSKILNARMLKSRFSDLVSQAIRKYNYSYFLSVSAEGPSVKLTFRHSNFMGSIDLVLAIKDESWPDDAEEWERRPRKGWPSPQLVREIVNDGCFLVAKKPPGNNSSEADLYWLYSFSQAEKKLSTKGSSYQPSTCRRKLLRILKSLREERTLQLTPLTSYHLKTIMLYEYEAYPQDHYWNDSQLAVRFTSALNRLLGCLRERNCPHYFIPALNLFDKENFNVQRYDYLIRKVTGLLDKPANHIPQ